MNLAFLDLCAWDYDVDTPYERSLGGSQSALAYLTPELAGRGHELTLFTRTTRPGLRRGVHCAGFEGELVPRGLERGDFAAAVVLNGPAEAGPALRAALADRTRLVLWTQHADDQPAVAALADPRVRAAWDLVVCVSDWQRECMLERFGLAPDRVRVRRNGIGPAFEGLFASATELEEAKSGPPAVVYTSTPFRGLDVLLHAFGQARERVPGARLEVYSSLAVYQVREEEDPCAALYADCRGTPGVDYVGSLPQPELAQALRGASFLGYPNTFPETSCISVLEALAAGLFVVTTELGALPETSMGWGALVPPAGEGQEGLLELSGAFSGALVDAFELRSRDPAAFAEARLRQVLDVNRRCAWSRRAEEWEALLSGG